MSTALPATAQRTIDRRVAVRPDGFVRIANLAGSLKVTGWDRDSLVVTGTVDESRGVSFHLGVAEDGARVGIWSDDVVAARPSHLEMYVPRTSQVWIRTGSAEVNVAQLTGGVDINTTTGRITVNGNPRELFAESLGGAIDVAVDTRSVRAKTASGDIRVRGTVRDASATSVSGNLTIEGESFERGSFESVDGDIRYFGRVGRGGALDFISHSGVVEFLLSADASAEFFVSTFYGDFDDQFGVKPAYGGNKLRGREIRFTLGTGGGHVTVRNFKGRVVLRRKG
jgi:hypothetical protein